MIEEEAFVEHHLHLRIKLLDLDANWYRVGCGGQIVVDIDDILARDQTSHNASVAQWTAWQVIDAISGAKTVLKPGICLLNLSVAPHLWTFTRPQKVMVNVSRAEIGSTGLKWMS